MLCVLVVHYLYHLDVFHCMDIPLFIYAFICCLSFFQVLAIMNKPVFSIGVQVFVWICFLFVFFLNRLMDVEFCQIPFL